MQRPPIDPQQAQVFGRPHGVAGSFAGAAQRRRDPRMVSAPPPDPALAQAFGRPPGAQASLQRGAPETVGPTELAESDPWRDARSGARPGPPALGEDTEPEAEPGPPTAKLGARELLLGSRVRPSALAALVVLALAVGAIGGLVGRGTADVTSALTDANVTLAQVDDGAAPPANGVAATAAAVLPSVVSVEVRAGDTGGSGSGVVIDGGGYIVTNNHVISQAATNPSGATLDVVFSDGTRQRAQIVGRDTKTDLAVLRATTPNLTVAQLGRSNQLNVGDPVIAIGSPLGLAGTVTTGIISAKQRPVRLSGDGTDTDAVIDALQTDAAINPGNSGGPLVDYEGRVVGINSAIRTSGGDSGGSIGLGFAIPVDQVTAVAQEIIRTGSMRHPTIGVNVRSVTDGSTDGAAVANVQDGSAAARAGLAEGDVIVQVGDRTIAGAEELTVAIQERTIGEPVPLRVVRAGRTIDIQVTPDSD
ncbi:trypsin-like peptidase domain-containing protein [Rhodococcus sp. X156]|uniref:S1C family serine protease n=1 Tax=Rhodococcus sp. X156 TaxID=2499145 RepID=UPI001F49C268|nr:trypsin-like peptidase domain-containing protein [Rhodococcus sp. X156]